ncbi:sulfatase-like hydrolase/transferase [candidate division KSB1 bacterium]|nr:sulfatase-like hydrolase/transferase [candidate division KSB1 bacterium]
MKPNILVIITDQQRQDHLGCYGNKIIQTPNIDRLADSGIRFNRHYVNNPLCMPGRATLFTGLTPRGHTVRTNGINLPPQFTVLPEILNSTGYQTHLIGKLHLNCHHSKVPGMITETENHQALKAGKSVGGFESGEMSISHGTHVRGAYHDWLQKKLNGSPNPWLTIRENQGYGAEQCIYTEISEELHHSTWVANRTIDFLKHRDSTRPFFVWCSFPDPHHPFCPPPKYAELYPPEKIPVPVRRDGELDDLPPHFRQAYAGAQQFSGRAVNMPTKMADIQYREIIGLTYGMISLIDANVGRILNALNALQLEDETLVIFTSDHGDLMGDHWLMNKGPFHFEGLLKVPFIVRLPSSRGAGRAVDCLTSHLDFPPTILDFANMEFSEENVPHPPEAPLQRPALPGKSLMPILSGESFSLRDAVLVENDEDYLGINLRTLITERFKLTCYSDRDFGELFDLQQDPGELHNLWAAPEFATLKNELKLRLLDELMRTECPLPRRIGHA